MRNFTYIFTILIFFWAGKISAQNNTDTLNVLFVGNSYTFNHNIPQLVSLLSDSTRTKLITSKSTAGGATLKNHWKGDKKLETKEKIRNGKYDIVVLQEQSMGTILHPDTFLLYAERLCNLITESGARPCFYETWSREKVPPHQKIITKYYSRAAEENDALIARVGEAWELARQYRPTAQLYDDDGSHQSAFGAFIAACMFVSTITEEIPENLRKGYFIKDADGESVHLNYLDALDLTFCLELVKEMNQKKVP